MHAYTRKPLSPPDPSSKLTAITEPDNSKWTSLFPTNTTIFFSALGTTRANAGGFAKQKTIDHDLNVALATTARAGGVRTYVLISSGGANKDALLGGYMRMKGETEDAVSQLDFEDVVILRPGLIMGERQESRLAEAAFRKLAVGLGKINTRWLMDSWAVEAEVIARAAVKAGEMCGDGKKPEGVGKVWMLGQADIVRLGRTEWKD